MLVIKTGLFVVPIAFTPDSRSIAIPDIYDVKLYPLDLDFLDVEPQPLLEQAEAAAGSQLDGFVLRSRP